MDGCDFSGFGVVDSSSISVESLGAVAQPAKMRERAIVKIVFACMSVIMTYPTNSAHARM